MNDILAVYDTSEGVIDPVYVADLDSWDTQDLEDIIAAFKQALAIRTHIEYVDGMLDLDDDLLEEYLNLD